MLEKKFVKALLCLVVTLSFSATGALGGQYFIYLRDEPRPNDRG